jgi:hypothetical protein
MKTVADEFRERDEASHCNGATNNGHRRGDADESVRPGDEGAEWAGDDYPGDLPAPTPRLIRLSEITVQRTEWVWGRRIARGTINLIDGDPGLGKSLVTLDIATRITRGWEMPPDGRIGLRSPGNVLLIGSEDDLARVVKPRLAELGADMDRILSLEEIEFGGEEFPIELPNHLPIIEDVIRRHQIILVVVDPFLSFIGGEYDSHKDSDMRRLMAKIKRVAERTQAAFLLVRHLNKLVNVENAVYRGGGSIGIIGAARSALLVAKHPDDGSQRILARAKGNLSVDPEALAYSIESVGGEDGWPTIVWHGTVDPSADQMLARKQGKADEARDRKNKSNDARVLNALDQLAKDGAASMNKVRVLAGMNSDTMTRTVARLIADDIVEEVVVTVQSGQHKRNEEVGGLRRKRVGGTARTE